MKNSAMESVFVTENSIDIDRFESECNEMAKLKIGEVFYSNNNDFVMSCIHCTQEFHHFTEFTLHIQEHYRRVGIGQLAKDIHVTDDANKRIEKQSNESDDDEFPDVFMDKDYGSSDEPDDSEPIPINSDHIVLEPLIEFSAPAEQPIRFIEGTDYERQDHDDYRCLICAHQSSAGWHHFRDHLLTHSNRPHVFCPICSKAFANAAYVRKHVNRTHKMKITADRIRAVQSTLAMETTGAAVPTATATIEQQRTQPAEPVRTFVEGEDYEKSNGRFKCLTCGQKILDHIKEHLMTHSTAKNVYCPLCEKAFIAVSYVRKHVNRAHKMKITAEEIKIAQTTIDAAKENDNKIQADKKGAHDDLQSDVRHSPIKKTADETAATGPRMTQKNFECFDCHRAFMGLSSLRIHMKLHSGVKYLCPYCEKVFAMRSYVRDHVVIMHGIKRDDIPKDSIREVTGQNRLFSPRQPKTDTPFHCNHCKKIYDTKQKLRQHMKLHSNVPHLCVICGIVYKSLANFKYHMERHQAKPNQKHQCLDASCQKTFSERRYMLKHYRAIHLQKGKVKTVKSE